MSTSCPAYTHASLWGQWRRRVVRKQANGYSGGCNLRISVFLWVCTWDFKEACVGQNEIKREGLRKAAARGRDLRSHHESPPEMEQLATGGREALVTGDIQATWPLGGNVVVGWVEQDHAQDGDPASWSISAPTSTSTRYEPVKSRLPLLPLLAPSSTRFSSLLLKFSEGGKWLHLPQKCSWNQKGLEKGSPRTGFGTRAHSSLVFQRRTLSPGGCWLTSDLVGIPILCLSRQDVALVDFIMVNQVINCQCGVFMGLSVRRRLLQGSNCDCLV